jgi:EF hand
MKTNLKTLLALLALGAATLTLRAQDAPPSDPGQPGQDGARHHRPPPSLLLKALDANHDGTIDSNEMANASAALTTLAQSLNTNGVIQLTRDQLRPARPNRPDGPPPGGEDRASATNQDGAMPPPGDGAPGQGHRHGPPMDPLFQALDTNHDGVISADEIANAPAALKTLDKNGDGQLTREELRPARPQHADKGGQEGERPDGPPPGGPEGGQPPQ